MTRPKHKTASEGLATLIGQTITKIEGLENGSEKVSFITPSDTVTLEYFPDCCASCPLDDFDGDPNDLLGSPILLAEEVSNDAPAPEYADSYTWTFYKFATVKGYVTLKFLGQSNGYYSETVTVVVNGESCY